MKSSQFDNFETRSIPSLVLSMIIPTILSNIVMIVYSLADTYFVGFLNSGPESAAVSLCSPILLSFNAVNNLFGIGAGSLLSRALGENNPKLAAKASSAGFWGALACGIIFSLAVLWKLEPLCLLAGATDDALAATVSYMYWAVVWGAPFSILNVVLAFLVRSQGDALQASVGTMSGAILNIILDPILIFTFGMNSEGAALATCFSNAFATLYFLAWIWMHRKTSVVRISPALLSWEKALWIPILSVGIPAGIQNLLNVVSQILMNNAASAYGTDALAATGIAFRIATVLVYISVGITQGTMPLFAYAYGARQIQRLKESIRFTFWLAVLSIGSLGIVFSLFSRQIMSLFISIESIIEPGSILLRGMAVAPLFVSIDFIGVSTLQACDRGILSLWLALFRKLVCEIPLLFILVSLFGLYGIGWTQAGAEFLTSILSMILLARFLSRLKSGTLNPSAS